MNLSCVDFLGYWTKHNSTGSFARWTTATRISHAKLQVEESHCIFSAKGSVYVFIGCWKAGVLVLCLSRVNPRMILSACVTRWLYHALSTSRTKGRAQFKKWQYAQPNGFGHRWRLVEQYKDMTPCSHCLHWPEQNWISIIQPIMQLESRRLEFRALLGFQKVGIMVICRPSNW